MDDAVRQSLSINAGAVNGVPAPELGSFGLAAG